MTERVWTVRGVYQIMTEGVWTVRGVYQTTPPLVTPQPFTNKKRNYLWIEEESTRKGLIEVSKK